MQPGSPSINAGDNGRLPPDTPDLDADGNTLERVPLDLDGNARIQNCTVDMGAYEFVTPVTRGDSDCDADVDLADFLELQRCFGGPSVAPEPACESFDFDGDNDVDLSDLVAFQAGFTGARGDGVRIVSLLPNPVGADRGHEQVTIGNFTDNPLDLAGWTLRDRASNKFRLRGTVLANSNLTITMEIFSMPLNNNGDEVSLIDPDGMVRHHVEYSEADVTEGRIITFP